MVHSLSAMVCHDAATGASRSDHPKEKAMTSAALFPFVVLPFALFLVGGFLLWWAIFLALIWLLHYEPAHITGLPTSSYKRIAYIMLYTAVGVMAIGTGVLLVVAFGAFGDYITTVAEYTTTDVVIFGFFGCLSVPAALLCLAMGRLSIVELRRAVRLRRQ
jgi:hypothetical protein